jgi:hypothetical protein
MPRLLLSLALLAALAPIPALADACTDEIAALFHGGALDPFTRPPHMIETTTRDASGAVQYEMLTLWDTPLRSLSGMKGQMVTLMIGPDTWIGPGPQGPWTKAPNQNPPDMAAFQAAIRDQLAANLRDTACPGQTTLDGQTFTTYRFTTQTDPNPDQGGSYFGAAYTVYISPETGLLAREDQTGAFAHYQPAPGTDTTVALYSYDPALQLAAPD